MASAEGVSVLSGVEYGEECSLPSRLEGLGERHELSPWGPQDTAPTENGFWRLLKATECSFLYLQCESKKSSPPPKTFCDIFTRGEPV